MKTSKELYEEYIKDHILTCDYIGEYEVEKALEWAYNKGRADVIDAIQVHFTDTEITTTQLTNAGYGVNYTECPCCGELISVDDPDMREYEKEGKVYMECYSCERKFYLIKE